MNRGVKVSVKKAVSKCIGVVGINARVSCSEAQCEGAYGEAVHRCHGVSIVMALGAAWGQVLERGAV